HVPDGAVADDARVVDEDVDAAELVPGPGEHPVDVGIVADVTEVGDGPAAAALDHLHDPGSVVTLARTVDPTAEVVHHDGRPVPGELDRVPAPDAVSRASDDGDLSLQQPGH